MLSERECFLSNLCLNKEILFQRWYTEVHNNNIGGRERKNSLAARNQRLVNYFVFFTIRE